jgi:hypothetical protein
MDEIVKAALVKWPNVPHCRGWLGLDARGNWWLRDAQTQAAGDFPAVKGSLIEHEGLREFVGRNYACDAAGDWYFQNGPQRVYVELEAAPWIWRLSPASDPAAPAIASHIGRDAVFESAWVDGEGRLYLATDIGFGLVHSMDVAIAAIAVESGSWRPQEADAASLPGRFGYRLSPQREQQAAITSTR